MPTDAKPGLASPTHAAAPEVHNGQRRQSRSGSVAVVCPEAADQGKPKLFARQSFVVTGDDQMMAETILEARKLAMERRRSVADDGGVHPLARRASADSRRSSKDSSAHGGAGTDHAAAAATATAQHAANTAAAAAAATAAGGGGEATVASEERRRSSVIHRLPASLRALMQQSDENGIQQKCENPYAHQLTGVQEAEDDSTASTTERDDGVTAATAAAAANGDASSNNGQAHGGQHQQQQARWCSTLMSCFKPADEDDAAGDTPKKEGIPAQTSTTTSSSNTAPATSTTTTTAVSTTAATSSNGSAGNSPTNSKKKGLPAAVAEPPVPASLLPPQRQIHSGRKLLVLDLDETLVHSSFKPVSHSDYVLDIMVDSTSYKVYVLKRPGVDEFLERVAKDYEVIIFTASLPQYANPLLDILDPKGYITARLFREHCTFHEGYFVKDLTMLRNNMDLTDTIIVDNSPMAYMFQPDNAIDCTSWLEDGHDEELYVIADFLEKTKDVSDVRDYVEFWREGAEVISENNQDPETAST